MSALGDIKKALELASLAFEIGAKVLTAMTSGTVLPSEAESVRRIMGKDLASRVALVKKAAEARTKLGG